MDVDVVQGLALFLIALGNVSLWLAFNRHIKRKGHDGRN